MSNSSFADSEIVAEVATAILAACTKPRVVSLDALPPLDQQRYKRIAIMALRSQNPAIVDLATWMAAEAVAVEHYGLEFDQLNEREQRACRLMSVTAILAYEGCLKGHTDAYREKSTMALVEKIKARLAARQHTARHVCPQCAAGVPCPHTTAAPTTPAEMFAFGKLLNGADDPAPHLSLVPPVDEQGGQR